ncbi:Mn2+-dependent serine/threonine protein kinase [Ordospora colligata]|uniref:non-specific serine/threonine protein kinase n=1 Tax=Ordospora colligata OC4 TaxID=1354746 RepID=A0A0B2UJL0_9MICR|nr:Mn2+-dependent serine/threonine protein kinase [Ordospora colligata OC4]KHN69543.1 Mn2+-dependent serine/threonine protein kinase [Ordospora colligata OC4]TBU15363.1 Mn2+-dependent serine/threonine protein kinase [Ordospora colligata]TBU15463.1 Mn2+-dependent serine/threonine protein kinase [Ordospora colligata]TBU18559.1 Mn2+-dependent serine/threonine protein kinase [Ordospora colligata]
MEFIFLGAESSVSTDGKVVLKERMKKEYRIEELDRKIIRSRTKREANIMKKLNKLGIACPKLIKVSENTIVMQKVMGKTMKEYLSDVIDHMHLFYEVGVLVGKLHSENIVHGDLTTSNFIFGDQVYVIDFGLSSVSPKDEDKAVDLYVFEKAVGCVHNIEDLQGFYQGYLVHGNPDVLKKLEVVRMRGRKRDENSFG